MKKTILNNLLTKVIIELEKNTKKLENCVTLKDVKNRKNTLLELGFYRDLIVLAVNKTDSEYNTLLDLEGIKKPKLSFGNSKTGVASWNILEIVTCTHATPQCKKQCYAIKSSIQYKAVLFQRIHNTLVALRTDFHKLLAEELRKSDISKLRVHDAGGFMTKEYTNQIIKVIKINKNIEFVAYTKSIEVAQILNGLKNAVASYSIFMDTEKAEIEKAELLDVKSFECLEFKEFQETKKVKCPIFSSVKVNKNIPKQKTKITCYECGMCFNKDIKQIAVLKH